MVPGEKLYVGDLVHLDPGQGARSMGPVARWLALRLAQQDVATFTVLFGAGSSGFISADGYCLLSGLITRESSFENTNLKSQFFL